jgi:uncharacterized protein (TIGR00369 family)
MSPVEKKSSKCYVCGPDNPMGLRVEFGPHGAQGSRACYTALAEHTGWDGVLHGGVILALMDEAFGWSLFFQDIAAVTARVEARFHKPIPVGVRLIVTAQVLKQHRRLFEARAEVREDGLEKALFAEATATMCLIGRGKDEA